VIAIIAVVVIASLAAAPERALSVCEAARVSDQLDGKMVRISGVLRKAHPALDLFDELVGTKCPGVEIHVVATVGSLPVPPPAGYKLDEKSTRMAQRVAEKALADGRDLSATIVGVLYVQKKQDYVPARPLNKDVMVPPHHKWYPLVLLIESVPHIQER
jgi:hypothetical protein